MADDTFHIDRSELERVFVRRAAKQFEDMQRRVSETEEITTAGVEATATLQQATFVTLSPNADLSNEYVLGVGSGLRLVPGTGAVTLFSDAPRLPAGHSLSFITSGNSQIAVPITGTMATREGAETLAQKTLAAPKLSGLGDYVNDAAAAAGGVPVGGVYRNGSVLMVRVA